MNKSSKIDEYLILIDSIMNKYKLNSEEKEELTNLIYHIIKHQEFKRRTTKEFLHHGKTTLGEHILEDTIITYLICKKRQRKGQKIDLPLAISIALMHDLYTDPWQTKTYKPKKFKNSHGFRHPIEAVINSLAWYPEVFSSNIDTQALIDGIIHHMYPFPTRIFKSKEINNLELKNYELISSIDKKYLDIIITSTKRGKIGQYSIAKPYSKEGRIVSKADKIASTHDFDSIRSVIACLGTNTKKLEKN